MIVATFVVATAAIAPTPDSRPDHSNLLTSGLSDMSAIQSNATVADAALPDDERSQGSRPPQIISTISVFAWSSSALSAGVSRKIHWVRTCSINP